MEMSLSPFHGIFSFGQEDGATTQATRAPSIPYDLSRQPASAPQAAQPASVPTAKTGQIAVDIYEQDDYYIIRAPIAGVRLSDLDIEVDDKVLTIRGTRRLPDDVQPHSYYLQECFWGEFSRSITLPTSIDPKKVKATFSKDSILKVLVPKEERVKIVRISEGN